MNEHGQLSFFPLNCQSNRPQAEKPLKRQDLSLRDGHQSLFATRGRTEDMLPIAEKIDAVGFWPVETWGGATFDAERSLTVELGKAVREQPDRRFWRPCRA